MAKGSCQWRARAGGESGGVTHGQSSARGDGAATRSTHTIRPGAGTTSGMPRVRGPDRMQKGASCARKWAVRGRCARRRHRAEMAGLFSGCCVSYLGTLAGGYDAARRQFAARGGCRDLGRRDETARSRGCCRGREGARVIDILSLARDQVFLPLYLHAPLSVRVRFGCPVRSGRHPACLLRCEQNCGCGGASC